jgi:hypothetical protein
VNASVCTRSKATFDHACCRNHASARFSLHVAEGEARARRFCTSLAIYYERTPPNTSDGSIARYYDPGTGQFLSVDPALDATGQPYAYTNDDPVNPDHSRFCLWPVSWS